MTSDSGSSGGGSSGGSSEKNKTESISKSTGKTTSGTLTPEQVAQSLSGNTDYSKAPASTVAGTGAPKDTYTPPSVVGGSGIPQSISQGGGGGGGAIDTTVNQTPAAGGDGAETTTVTATPRSDYSVVLAGQVGTKPDRSPARSNNFVSLVGGAGGLGRRTSEAKRTLIGGT